MLAMGWLINGHFGSEWEVVVQKIIFNWAELFVCWYFIKNLNGWDSFPGIYHLADRISVLTRTESDHLSLSLLSSATSYQAEWLKSLQMTFPKPVLECLIMPKNHLEFLGNLVIHFSTYLVRTAIKWFDNQNFIFSFHIRHTLFSLLSMTHF